MDKRNVRGEAPHEHHDDPDGLPPELRAVAERYAALPVPRPTTDDTTRLVARLVALEPDVARATPDQRHIAAALRVARWRLRLLGPWFWVASVVLFLAGAGATLAGAWVTPASGHASPYPLLPLILLAPLTVVLGIAHALRGAVAGVRAVEASAPIGFVEVTAGLVLAIVAFDGLLGTAATVALALLRWAPFASLLAAWLGPLLLLAGISLPVALRWGAGPAAAIGGLPWLVLAVLASIEPHGAYGLAFTVPGDAASLLAHVAAGGLGAVALAATLTRGAAWRPLAAPQGA